MNARSDPHASRRRALLFSCEPGGAEVLIPVIAALRQAGFEVCVTTYAHGLDRFRAKGIACREIGPVARGDLSLLREVSPDVVITSATSLPDRDMSDRHLWLGARALGIPSVAFLDQWQNYAARFSGVTVSEHMAYLPDYINCINDVGEREMLAAGFAAARLRKFGHPYLSSLKTLYDGRVFDEAASRVSVRPGDEVSLFVSESIREHFGRARGYDQFDALDMFFGLLEKDGAKPQRAILKLHPKDDVSAYTRYLAQRDGAALIVTNELTPMECVGIADWVFGMSSIMLIEAFIVGKPVISLQPGLVVEDPFVLSRLGLIPLLTVPGTDPPPAKTSGASQRVFNIQFEERTFVAFLEGIINNSSGQGGEPQAEPQ